MSTAFKKAMKQKLLDLKEQILQQLVSESDEFQEIVDDMEPKDLADIAADDIDRRREDTVALDAHLATRSHRVDQIVHAIYTAQERRLTTTRRANQRGNFALRYRHRNIKESLFVAIPQVEVDNVEHMLFLGQVVVNFGRHRLPARDALQATIRLVTVFLRCRLTYVRLRANAARFFCARTVVCT